MSPQEEAEAVRTKILQYAILTKTSSGYIQNNFVLNCTREAVFEDMKKANSRKGSIARSLQRFQNSTTPAPDGTRRLGDQGNIIAYDPLEKTFNVFHLLVSKPETATPLPPFTPELFNKQFRPDNADPLPQINHKRKWSLISFYIKHLPLSHLCFYM